MQVELMKCPPRPVWDRLQFGRSVRRARRVSDCVGGRGTVNTFICAVSLIRKNNT
jgi:hypothetical protein